MKSVADSCATAANEKKRKSGYERVGSFYSYNTGSLRSHLQEAKGRQVLMLRSEKCQVGRNRQRIKSFKKSSRFSFNIPFIGEPGEIRVAATYRSRFPSFLSQVALIQYSVEGTCTEQQSNPSFTKYIYICSGGYNEYRTCIVIVVAYSL